MWPNTPGRRDLVRGDLVRGRGSAPARERVAESEVVEREDAPVALADVERRLEEAPERGEVRSFVATVHKTLAAPVANASEYSEIRWSPVDQPLKPPNSMPQH